MGVVLAGTVATGPAATATEQARPASPAARHLLGWPGGGLPSVATSWSTPAVASADDVRRYVARRQAELHLPGVAVVVLSGGTPLLSAGFGTTGRDGQPFTDRTPVVLGSTSKQLTGLLVQELVLRGRLRLSTTAHQVLPWFGTGHDERSRITVRELLAQTSGLSTRVGLAQWGWRGHRAQTIADGVRAIAEADVTGPPGGGFVYSNSNYDVLGAIVEAVTGLPFAQALDQLVVRPLGLRSTTADLTSPPPGLAAGSYVWLGSHPVVTPAPLVPSAVPSAMIVSTADDLARIARAHLQPGGALGPALVAARAPLVRVGDGVQYASGWWVRPLWEADLVTGGVADPPLPWCLEHDGTTDRSMSYVLVCPTSGLVVVALADAGQGPDQGLWAGFTGGLLHTVLGTPTVSADPAPVIRYAAQLFVGLPLLLLATLIGQLRALRRRRRVLPWSATAVLLGLGAAWLGYAYAPSTAGDEPIVAMWSTVPDLAASTITSSLLTLASVVVLVIAWRCRPTPGRSRSTSRAPSRSGDARSGSSSGVLVGD